MLKEKTENQLNYNFMTFILAWSGFVILMSMYITIPLTSVFVTALNISTTEAVWIGSAFSLCYAICCLFYGPLSDKWGRKIFMVYGIGLLTIITFAIGFAENYHILLALRALQGIAAAAFIPISLVYTAELFPPQKRLTAIGFITSGFLIASVVSQVFGLIINASLGWQAIFISLGIIYLATAILVIFFLPKDQVQYPDESILRKYIQMKDLFKNPKLCIAFVITFMLLFSLVGMYTILGDYLASEKFGFTEQEILTVRALGIISMLMSMFAGKISGKYGVILSLRIALLVAALALFLMGVSSSAIILILCSLLFVGGIAFVVPVNISLVNIFAGAQRGSAVLFNAFILFLGASVGPMLAIKLMESGNYLLSFSIFSIVLFIGFLLSLFIKKTS
ncbi:MFS transporter [Lysinibacillus yapensis]|uniref:MFS transporter n=1 Tax=Ureibacillus yapensis TaxID=2304605 RepID=A0A396S5N6_9BACL|nr:MFS transporter [Lysinibacillus yapensis]RHW34068.1 MFS transporter [Lysinibacillus yapensis]